MLRFVTFIFVFRWPGCTISVCSFRDTNLQRVFVILSARLLALRRPFLMPSAGGCVILPYWMSRCRYQNIFTWMMTRWWHILTGYRTRFWAMLRKQAGVSAIRRCCLHTWSVPRRTIWDAAFQTARIMATG